MAPGNIPKRDGKRNGTTGDGTGRSIPRKPIALDEPDGPVSANITNEEPGSNTVCRLSRVPTIDEIKSELWSIGTGDGSESSRVSALRALADLMGLLRQAPPDFPEGMTALLDALAEGLGRGSNS